MVLLLKVKVIITILAFTFLSGQFQNSEGQTMCCTCGKPKCLSNKINGQYYTYYDCSAKYPNGKLVDCDHASAIFPSCFHIDKQTCAIRMAKCELKPCEGYIDKSKRTCNKNRIIDRYASTIPGLTFPKLLEKGRSLTIFAKSESSATEFELVLKPNHNHKKACDISMKILINFGDGQENYAEAFAGTKSVQKSKGKCDHLKPGDAFSVTVQAETGIFHYLAYIIKINDCELHLEFPMCNSNSLQDLPDYCGMNELHVKNNKAIKVRDICMPV